VGIKLGDGLGDFMKFTTDDESESGASAPVGGGDLDRKRSAEVSGATGVRSSTRYYGAHSTGIH
jgi:hypothetical protein